MNKPICTTHSAILGELLKKGEQFLSADYRRHPTHAAEILPNTVFLGREAQNVNGVVWGARDLAVNVGYSFSPMTGDVMDWVIEPVVQCQCENVTSSSGEKTDIVGLEKFLVKVGSLFGGVL